MVESLAAETKQFNIQTLLIQPGRFRTKFLAEQHRKDSRASIPDYAEGAKHYFGILDAESENQPGDVTKGVSVMVDLVRKEGVAKDREIPFRIPLGNDCAEEVKGKIQEMGRVMEEWKDVIGSTDHS